MTARRPGRVGDGSAGRLAGDGPAGALVGQPGPAGRRSACVPGLLLRPLLMRPGGRRRPADGRPRGRGGIAGLDRGSATVELAASLPALMVLVLAGVMAVSAAGTKVRCGSAARDAALAAARGEDGTVAAGRVAPDGAAVRVSADGDLARATVSAQVRPFGNLLPAFTVSGTAVAAVEPGPP
jgi:hypothetical protein